MKAFWNKLIRTDLIKNANSILRRLKYSFNIGLDLEVYQHISRIICRSGAIIYTIVYYDLLYKTHYYYVKLFTALVYFL